MKLKTLILSTLTLSTFSYAGVAQVMPEPFSPTIEIKKNITTILPQTGAVTDDKGENNIVSYLLPKIKKGKIELENETSIGFCGEKTYIITVGINKYRYLPSLTNSISSAKTITNKIESSCQKTKSYSLENSKKEELLNTLGTISKKMTSKDTLIFYFSGHGVRYKAKDYIALAHAKPKAHDIKPTWVSIKEIASYFKATKIKSGLMIFDAGRDQPFKSR